MTLEQATYFAPGRPERFAPDRMPLWIWMDEPSFYGFPCYGEPTVKAAQDCGGPAVDPDARGSDAGRRRCSALLAGHMARMLPGSGRPVRSLRCQYTLTPDRDFVIDRVPGHPSRGGRARAPGTASSSRRPSAGCSPTWRRGSGSRSRRRSRCDRPALTDPSYVANWLV